MSKPSLSCCAFSLGYGLLVSSLLIANAATIDPIRTSIISLIANPDKYDKRVVSCRGYLRDRFEEKILFLSENDAERLITENGVWMVFDKDAPLPTKPTESKSFDNRYVRVIGTFDKNATGHLSACPSGGIHVSYNEIILVSKDEPVRFANAAK